MLILLHATRRLLTMKKTPAERWRCLSCLSEVGRGTQVRLSDVEPFYES
jgi:hypothetical protein